MDSVIYYFSGSGNSYHIAKGIGEILGNTKLIRICSDNMHLSSENRYKKIGIIFPVYYFSIPKMVKVFIESLNIVEDTYIYAVATCGGFVGVSFVDIRKILKEKGHTLSSTFKIIMPDNYQILYSPATEEKQRELINNSDKEVEMIVSIVKDRKGHFINDPNIFLTKIEEIGARIFNPKNKDNNFWTDDNCNGCKVCEKVCPAKDIVMEDNRPKWLNNCEQCLACFQWCPQQAIQYKRSTIKKGRYTHPKVKQVELYVKN